MQPFQNPAVATVFGEYPKAVRHKLMALRERIFDVAASTPSVGALHETLKWGEPAYVTLSSKSGSTIRLGWKKSAPHQYAMYFICTTTLVDTFRAWFPNQLTFIGNRAIVFDATDDLPEEAVRHCIAAALTYHLSGTRGRGRRGVVSSPSS